MDGLGLTFDPLTVNSTGYHKIDFLNGLSKILKGEGLAIDYTSKYLFDHHQTSQNPTSGHRPLTFGTDRNQGLP